MEISQVHLDAILDAVSNAREFAVKCKEAGIGLQTAEAEWDARAEQVIQQQVTCKYFQIWLWRMSNETKDCELAGAYRSLANTYKSP
jgi:hypothetical protein